MISEVTAGWALEIGAILFAGLIPGISVFFASARWGRKGALISAALGDLWGWGLIVTVAYLALGCHGCERLDKTWLDVFMEWAVSLVGLFFVLWPFHLVWAVIAVVAGALGERRHARPAAVRRKPEPR